jgi:hypothetical protein
MNTEDEDGYKKIWGRFWFFMEYLLNWKRTSSKNDAITISRMFERSQGAIL